MRWVLVSVAFVGAILVGNGEYFLGSYIAVAALFVAWVSCNKRDLG
jgi:hypothetical protein